MFARNTGHTWRFFRAGGFDQVRIDTGADLLALRQLDQKLWVALACPTTGLQFDPRTLAILDDDKDGRIRASDIVDACEWVGGLLVDRESLPKGLAELPLDGIQQDSAEGALFVQAARAVLRSAKKPDAHSITVEDATQAVDAFNAAGLNGDGIITPDSAPGPELAAVITELITCVGSAPDRSGRPGLDLPRVEQFFNDLRAHQQWRQLANRDPALLPLGEQTAAARSVLAGLQPKVDDYFARCRLAAFDPRATGAMNRDEKEYAALAVKELTVGMAEIAALPLAQVAADQPLPLRTGLNPAWTEKMAGLAALCITPLLGQRDRLTDAEWTTLQAAFAAHDAWIAGKQGASVEKLTEARIEFLLNGGQEAMLRELVAQDAALAPVAGSLASVEKLVRLHRDLFTLVNNFVSFREFYSKRAKATFQAGTLYIDERSLELCIRVPDAAKHAELGAMSRMYLAYCECRRGDQKLVIAASFTNGDSDNLMVGRNGVFYDREGNDWDATIIKIVTSPISVRQAFMAPYKKLIRFVEEMVAKRAAEADEKATGRLTTEATDVKQAAETGQSAKPRGRIDIGTVAALGVAVGGITAALGAIFGALFGLGWLMPMGMVACVLAISGPSMLIAWLKLRQRNLAPMLDATGWAINSPARVNIPFGRSLTQRRRLPPGAARDLVDPYAEKRRPWWLYLLAVLVLAAALAWLSGKVDRFLPVEFQRDTVLKLHAAPAGPVAL
ncbi:MAG: hypothetical protein M3Y59_04580 [Myxococcota bacterium]|nr:hypothetical protein [Myxococcota bacterium]